MCTNKVKHNTFSSKVKWKNNNEETNNVQVKN